VPSNTIYGITCDTSLFCYFQHCVSSLARGKMVLCVENILEIQQKKKRKCFIIFKFFQTQKAGAFRKLDWWGQARSG